MTAIETATRTLPESIANLDLGGLGRKLLDDDAFEAERRNGERLWDEERVARALHEYRQFLALMYWNPDAVLVPSEDIDEVWHSHVLNTMRYQADCEAIFGCFQHHSPTFGASEEVQEAHLQGQDETRQLFEAAFGEVPQSYTCHEYLKCGRVNAKCGRTSAKCGRTAKCGRMDAKCGRMTAKCGRAAAKCGRVAKCGRTAKCGRLDAKCGRTTAKCGRM